MGGQQNPAELAKVLQAWRRSSRTSTARVRREEGLARRRDRAGGSAAIEKAAKDAEYDVHCAVRAGAHGRVAELTDVDSFALLEPRADGFRNYLRNG